MLELQARLRQACLSGPAGVSGSNGGGIWPNKLLPKELESRTRGEVIGPAMHPSDPVLPLGPAPSIPPSPEQSCALRFSHRHGLLSSMEDGRQKVACVRVKQGKQRLKVTSSQA